MVMGRDSHSEGCGFESRHCILDGHFFSCICCKNCNVCLKRLKNKRKKRPGLAHLKNRLAIVVDKPFDVNVSKHECGVWMYSSICPTEQIKDKYQFRQKNDVTNKHIDEQRKEHTRQILKY